MARLVAVINWLLSLTIVGVLQLVVQMCAWRRGAAARKRMTFSDFFRKVVAHIVTAVAAVLVTHIAYNMRRVKAIPPYGIWLVVSVAAYLVGDSSLLDVFAVPEVVGVDLEPTFAWIWAAVMARMTWSTGRSIVRLALTGRPRTAVEIASAIERCGFSVYMGDRATNPLRRSRTADFWVAPDGDDLLRGTLFARGVSFVVYCFSLPGVAGSSGGLTYNFDSAGRLSAKDATGANVYVPFVAPPDGLYVGHSWLWSYVYDVCSVPLDPADPTRVIMTATCLRSVPRAFAFLLGLPAMSAIAVGVAETRAGGVVVRRIGSNMHIAWQGSYTEVVVPYARMRSLYARWRLSDARNAGGAIQQELRSLDDPTNAGSLLQAFLPHLAVDEWGLVAPVAADGPDLSLPIPGGSYTVLTEGTSLDLVQDNALVLFSPIDVTGSMPTTDRGNELRGINSRVVATTNTAVPRSEVEKHALEYAVVIAELYTPGVAPYDHEVVESRMARPSQRAAQDQTYLGWHLRGPPFVRSFVKKSTGPVGDPRNISTLPVEHSASFAAYMMAGGDAMKALHFYGFGAGCGATSRRIHRLANMVKHVLVTDYSRFDGTKSEWSAAMQTVITLAMFFGVIVTADLARGVSRCEDAHALRSLLEDSVLARAVTRSGVSYETLFTMLSGNNNTTFGNTHDNACVAFIAFRVAGFTVEEAWDALGFYAGDDGFTPIPPCFEPKWFVDIYVAVANEIGFRLKAEAIESSTPMVVLGRLYPDAHAHAGSVATLDSTLSRAHIAPSTGRTAAQCLADKAGGLLVTDSATPLIGNFARSMRRGAGQVTAKLDPEDSWFLERYVEAGDPYEVPPEDYDTLLGKMSLASGYAYEEVAKLDAWLQANDLSEGSEPPCIQPVPPAYDVTYIRDGIVYGAVPRDMPEPPLLTTTQRNAMRRSFVRLVDRLSVALLQVDVPDVALLSDAEQWKKTAAQLSRTTRPPTRWDVGPDGRLMRTLVRAKGPTEPAGQSTRPGSAPIDGVPPLPVSLTPPTLGGNVTGPGPVATAAPPGAAVPAPPARLPAGPTSAAPVAAAPPSTTTSRRQRRSSREDSLTPAQRKLLASYASRPRPFRLTPADFGAGTGLAPPSVGPPPTTRRGRARERAVGTLPLGVTQEAGQTGPAPAAAAQAATVGPPPQPVAASGDRNSLTTDSETNVTYQMYTTNATRRAFARQAGNAQRSSQVRMHDADADGRHADTASTASRSSGRSYIAHRDPRNSRFNATGSDVGAGGSGYSRGNDRAITTTSASDVAAGTAVPRLIQEGQTSLGAVLFNSPLPARLTSRKCNTNAFLANGFAFLAQDANVVVAALAGDTTAKATLNVGGSDYVVSAADVEFYTSDTRLLPHVPLTGTLSPLAARCPAVPAAAPQTGDSIAVLQYHFTPDATPMRMSTGSVVALRSYAIAPGGPAAAHVLYDAVTDYGSCGAAVVGPRGLVAVHNLRENQLRLNGGVALEGGVLEAFNADAAAWRVRAGPDSGAITQESASRRLKLVVRAAPTVSAEAARPSVEYESSRDDMAELPDAVEYEGPIKASKPAAPARPHQPPPTPRKPTPATAAEKRVEPPKRSVPRASSELQTSSVAREAGILMGDAASSDYLGSGQQFAGGRNLAAAYVDQMVNPWSSVKVRLPDDNIRPTGLATFFANRTYTFPSVNTGTGTACTSMLLGMHSRLSVYNPNTGPTSGDEKAPSDSTEQRYFSPTYAYAPGNILSPILFADSYSSYNTTARLPSEVWPSKPWGDDYGAELTTTTKWVASSRPLSMAVRLRIVGLPSAQFMAPGKVYVAQIRNHRSDLPTSEQEFVNLERLGYASHVSTDAIRSAGSKTWFAVPDGADKFELSSAFYPPPGILDIPPAAGTARPSFLAFPTLVMSGASSGGYETADVATSIIPFTTAASDGGDPTVSGYAPKEVQIADQTMVLVVGFFGLQPGVVVEADYALVHEYVAAPNAPPGVDMGIQLRDSGEMDRIFGAASVLASLRPQMFQASGDRTQLAGPSGAPSSESRRTREAIQRAVLRSPGSLVRSTRREGFWDFDWMKKGSFGDNDTGGVTWDFADRKPAPTGRPLKRF